MAAINFIVMVVCAFWFLVYLDRHTNRGRKGRRQRLSSLSKRLLCHLCTIAHR